MINRQDSIIKVLTITNILPVSVISHKEKENNILLVIEDNLKEKYQNIDFKYLFIVPDTVRFLTNLSNKWKVYYQLKKKTQYNLENRVISILGIIQLPKPYNFRNILYEISFLKNKKQIKKILEEYKPTVIHAQNTDVDAYLARRIKEVFGIPYIVTLRGLNRVSDDRVACNLINAKHLLALSPTQKKEAQQLTDKKITLIPHGVPSEFFVDQMPQKNCERMKLISVCRLLKLKNLNLVVEALSKMKHEFVYDIYGEGPEMQSLQSLIELYDLTDKITLRGYVNFEHLPNILKKYDLFVMPSFPETLGRVYFEAMASGVPVIASKGTGIDGLIDEGEEGFLVENSSDSITKILEQLMGNTKKINYMSERAREFAKDYGWSPTLSKLYHLYE